MWATACVWAFLAVLVFGAFASAGTLLVANKSEDTVSVFATPAHEEIIRLPTGAGPHEVEVDPTGTFAAVSNYHEEKSGTLSIVHLGDLSVRTIGLGEHSGVHGLGWLPGSKRIAATSESANALLLVDVPTGVVLGAIPVEGESPHMLVLSEDGRFAWTANVGSGSVSKVDLQERRTVATAATGDGAEGIALAPDGARLWVSNRDEDAVVVLDPEDLREIGRVEVDGMPIRVELARDGALALVTSAVGAKITVIDAQSLEIVGEVSTRGETNWSTGRFLAGLFGLLPVPVGAQISEAGDSFYVANSFGGVVVEYGLDDLEVRRRIVAGEEPDGMAVTTTRSGS